MVSKTYTHTITLADGRTILLEKGALARQATSAVLLRMGGTSMLATVVVEKQEQPQNFLPLTVDYKEHFFAAGRIPGGFLKRQSRLSDGEVLKSRLIDRALRPCFPKDYDHAVQVEVHLLSHDKEVLPDTLAILAASTAIMTSSIPFQEALSAVRVARVGGRLCLNPTAEALAASDLNFTVAGTKDHLVMLEGDAHEVSEDAILEVLAYAQKHIAALCEAQQDFARTIQKEPALSTPALLEEQAHLAPLEQYLHARLYPAFYEVAKRGIATKNERKKAFSEAEAAVLASFGDQTLIKEHPVALNKFVASIKRQALRDLVLKEDLRVDGRRPHEVGAVALRADVLSAAHGAALFDRRDTQVLGVVTLGSKQDAQMVDDINAATAKNLSVYYSFPSFCTGEAKPNRGPSRRVIGHSNLIALSLQSQLPSLEEAPYVVDARAFTMTCDGSSSQASICALSAALMDAGVKLKNHVAGLAIGLVCDEACRSYKILSDIVSDEDACGDVDLKVAGTRNGITACQMDIKIGGIPAKIFQEMLLRAQEGRLRILDQMEEVVPAPRATFKPHVPVFMDISIATEKIGALIGPKGKTIQEIQKTTGATISVSEEGVVSIAAPDQKSAQAAVEAIRLVTAEPTTNTSYTGTVKNLMPYGAFIEFLPGKEGLLHVSDVRDGSVDDISTVLSAGQKVEVKLTAIKTRNGKAQYTLSMSSTDKAEKATEV